jgi:hypothetical protein
MQIESSTPSGSYTYDNNGNTLTDPTGKSYTWDFENRVTQVVVPGTGTVTFKDDPSSELRGIFTTRQTSLYAFGIAPMGESCSSIECRR